MIFRVVQTIVSMRKDCLPLKFLSLKLDPILCFLPPVVWKENQFIKLFVPAVFCHRPLPRMSFLLIPIFKRVHFRRERRMLKSESICCGVAKEGVAILSGLPPVV